MQRGMLAGLISGTDPLQVPASQFSRSDQQLSWSDGPSGEHPKGVGASWQRHPVVNSGSTQPSRDGDSWSDVIQFVTAQTGKFMMSIWPRKLEFLALTKRASISEAFMISAYTAVDRRRNVRRNRKSNFSIMAWTGSRRSSKCGFRRW